MIRRAQVYVTFYVLDCVLPAVNRLLAPEGLRIAVKQRGPMESVWIALERIS